MERSVGSISSEINISRSDFHFAILNPDDLGFRNFLSAWELSMFFESYVCKLVGQKASITKAILNPLVFVNPGHYIGFRDRPSISGYVELDGLLIKTDSGVDIVECKQSNTLDQRHVNEFLGKCHLLEKIYDIKIRKHVVSTGRRRPFLKKFEELSCFNGDFHIWCVEDFKNNYSGFLSQF